MPQSRTSMPGLLSDEIAGSGLGGSGRPPVVIITQSPVNRVVLIGVLSRLGYRSVSADFSYADFDNDNPSAVVIDCTGEPAACKPLFGRLAHASRPKVLMISGGERDPMAPVDHYVEKPMTTDKLEAAIHRLFGK